MKYGDESETPTLAPIKWDQGETYVLTPIRGNQIDQDLISVNNQNRYVQ